MPTIDRFAAMQHGVRPGVLLAAAALLLAGCATTAPKTPEEAVAQRAQARWAALLADDYETAYNLYSPGYREAVSLKGFSHRRSVQRVRWTEAELKSVECEEKLCRPVVHVSYKYDMRVQGVGVVRASRDVTEDWIFSDGGWFYLPPDLEGGGLR